MPKIRKKSLARALGAATTSVAAAAVAVVATGQPAQAVATLSGASAPVGATIRVYDSTINANTALPAVTLRPAADACASTYATPVAPVVLAESITKVDNTTVTVRVPSTLPLNTNGVARNYNVCVYQTASTGAALVSGTPPVLSAYQSLTSNPSSGVSGTTNNLTLNAANAIFTNITTPSALFTANPCPAAIPNPLTSDLFPAAVVKAGLANTSATVTVPAGIIGSGAVNSCLYAGGAAGDALLSAATYQLNLPQLVLSSSSGASDSTANITATSIASSMFSGIAAPGVLFTSAANCTSNWNTTTTPAAPVVAASAVRKLANNRIAVTIPPLPLNGTQPRTYQLCAYSGTSAESTVLGSAPYTATTLPTPTSVTPNAGPTTGGITITVNGTNFPTAPGTISATLGGVELLNVTPVNSTSFTATLPARSAGDNAALVVNTLAGSRTLPGAFSFRNALKLIGTNTAPNTSAGTDLVIQGTDFLSQAFGTSADNAKIYLVRGEYDSAADNNSNRANGPVAECTNPLVLSDTELVCTLRLNRRLDKTGSTFVDPVATATPLTGLSTLLGSRLLTSTSAVFGLDDVGKVLSQSGGAGEIPAGTTIKSVLTPYLAILSAPSPIAGNTLSAGLGGVLRTITGGTSSGNGLITRAGSNVVQMAGTPFTKADVGRVLNNSAPVPDGTTITAVAPNGASATLSANVPTATSGTVTLSANATAGATSLTGNFTAADLGAVFGSGTPGIPVGTKITQVSGGIATLSQPSVADIASAVVAALDRPVSLSLFPGAPVQDGAYNVTIVSNGAVNASTGADYKQTALTSGSIFTVSPF
ncbi:MAG TPA: IPT/TIG domain-containing protein [Actinoplanes sp.]|nr:IPT/TIG domain-containing protein [Actinoplanes sp.]